MAPATGALVLHQHRSHGSKSTGSSPPHGVTRSRGGPGGLAKHQAEHRDAQPHVRAGFGMSHESIAFTYTPVGCRGCAIWPTDLMPCPKPSFHALPELSPIPPAVVWISWKHRETKSYSLACLTGPNTSLLLLESPRALGQSASPFPSLLFFLPSWKFLCNAGLCACHCWGLAFGPGGSSHRPGFGILAHGNSFKSCVLHSFLFPYCCLLALVGLLLQNTGP